MKTEVLHIKSPQEDPMIRRAAQCLRQGDIVAFPTETVYGLGAKAERNVLSKLDAVKAREPGKRYSLHIGCLEDLTLYVPHPTFQAGKLMRNLWPGPVTIIFEPDGHSLKKIQSNLSSETYELLYQNGTLGVRYPNNPVACAILSAAVAPIIAPSANPAAQPPAVTADEVAAYFNGQIEVIVDAPEACKYRLNSTVVKIGQKGAEVLRQGVYSRQQILEAAAVRILFVCTGNTCRSPMAQALCRKYFADKFNCGLDEVEGFGYSMESAGIAAFEAMPASFHAMKVCRDRGIPLETHRSRGLTESMIRQADCIFVMNQRHLWAVTDAVADAKEKTFVLDPSGEISDPAGYDLDVYRRCADQIQRCIQERMNELL